VNRDFIARLHKHRNGLDHKLTNVIKLIQNKKKRKRPGLFVWP